MIEADGSEDTGVCTCCSCVSRLLWGHAAVAGDEIARYFVHWTLGEVVRHGAKFDLILGAWDDGVPDEGRMSVSLDYRLLETGPWFMVIDALDRPVSRMPFAGRPLSRPDVIGGSLAPVVFAIVDAICMKDPRLRALAPGWSTADAHDIRPH